MKYIMFVYQAKDFNPTALKPDEYKAVAERYAAITKNPNVRPGPPLGAEKDAITVRLRDGRSVATPGPYVQTPGGVVAGFMEFEAERDEEAIRLASEVPAVGQGGAVEIRPSKSNW